MRIKLFMNVWKGMETRYACATAQCPDSLLSPNAKIVSFTVEVPDEYIFGKEDHALGPVTEFKVEKI